jgi:hypothetical protein
MQRAFAEQRRLEEEEQAEQKASTKRERTIRGPERFFYDVKTYTGTHFRRAPSDKEPVEEAPVAAPRQVVKNCVCPLCEHRWRSRAERPTCPTCLNRLPDELVSEALLRGRGSASSLSEASTRASSQEARARHVHWWERGGDRDNALRMMALNEAEKPVHISKPKMRPPLPKFR